MIDIDAAAVERIVTEILRQFELEDHPIDNISSYIEHTLLRPDATPEQIDHLCVEAKKCIFYAVCVPPRYIQRAKDLLRGSGVNIVSVVGFPHGTALTSTKKTEAQALVERGVDELDMVLPIGAVKAGDWATVAQDITAVVGAAYRKDESRVLVKVILETGLLTDEEIVAACTVAKEAGADFVKTSTGFNGPGATVHHVALMRQVVGDSMGIKAAGGIRSREQAISLIQAGATRIGTSSGPSLLVTAST